MAIQLLRDPRPYVLPVLAVALIVVVPLMFAFITLIGNVFVTGPGSVSIVLWALLGVAVACLLVGVVLILSRAARLEELEHETPDGGVHRAP
jgi:hypothetical protein